MRGILCSVKDTTDGNSVGAYDVTLINVTINVAQRGFQIWYDDNAACQPSKLTVINSILSNSLISDFDKKVPANYTSGILLNKTSNATVTVSDTTIQGFDYSINFNVDPSSGETTNNNKNSITVNNCTFKGRAGLNLMALNNSDVSIKNCTILGINTLTGSSEGFGCIVVDNASNTEAENNTITIERTTFKVYRAPSTETNWQYAFDIRDKNNTINFVGENTFLADMYYNSDKSDFSDVNYTAISCNNADIKNSTTISGEFTTATVTYHSTTVDGETVNILTK